MESRSRSLAARVPPIESSAQRLCKATQRSGKTSARRRPTTSVTVNSRTRIRLRARAITGRCRAERGLDHARSEGGHAQHSSVQRAHPRDTPGSGGGDRGLAVRIEKERRRLFGQKCRVFLNERLYKFYQGA